MADLLIARLTDQHLVFPVGPQVFSPMVADTLGNAATDSDGFREMFDGVMLQVKADEPLGAQLDQHLAAADFKDGAIRATQVVPLGHDIDAFNSTIEPTSTGLNKAIATTPAGGGGVNLAALGQCQPGRKYNPFWQFMGWKDGCTPPSK